MCSERRAVTYLFREKILQRNKSLRLLYTVNAVTRYITSVYVLYLHTCITVYAFFQHMTA